MPESPEVMTEKITVRTTARRKWGLDIAAAYQGRTAQSLLNHAIDRIILADQALRRRRRLEKEQKQRTSAEQHTGEA